MASIIAPGKVRHYRGQLPGRQGHPAPPPLGAEADKGLPSLPMWARAPHPRAPTAQQQWCSRTCATSALAGKAWGLGIEGPTKAAEVGVLAARKRRPLTVHDTKAVVLLPNLLPSPPHPPLAGAQGILFGGCSSRSSSGKEDPRPAAFRGTAVSVVSATTKLPPQRSTCGGGGGEEEEGAVAPGPANAAPPGITPRGLRGPHVAALVGFGAPSEGGHPRLQHQGQERPERRAAAPAKAAVKPPRPQPRWLEEERARPPVAPAAGGHRPCSGGGDSAGASGGGGGGAAAAAVGLVRLVRNWSEASEVLELVARVGGPPPPRVQLKLLQRSRSFGAGSGGSGAARADLEVRFGGGFGAAATAGGWGARGETHAGPGFGEYGLLSRGGEQVVGKWCAGGLEGPGDEWAWLEALTGKVSGDAVIAPADTPAVEDSTGVCSSASVPTATATPITSSTTVAMMEAAEDAGWCADWDLEWDTQIHLHAHWLLQGPGFDGAAVPGSQPVAASRAAVLLPGHVAAAAAAAAQAGPQYDPIPPLPPRARSPDGPCSRLQHQQPKRQLQWQQQEPGVQLDVQRDGDRHCAEAHKHPTASSQPQHPTSAANMPAGRPAWRAAAVGSGSAAIARRPAAAAAAGDAADAKWAVGVLARIVFDATVVQPEAWTDAQIGALLQSAAKLAHRYPGILGPLQRSQQPPQPAMRAQGAGAVAAGAAAAVQLRVQLQQLLLRLDGLLAAPPRRGSDANASAKATRTRTTARTTAPLAGATVTSDASDEAVRSAVYGANAAVAPGALPVAAAASTVWAAATLQLRLSPDGRVRRCLLSSFIRPWRRRRAPRWGQEQQQQQQQQQRSQQQRRWHFLGRVHRLQLRSLGARGTAAAAAAALRPGQLAEMLWALATLGIQMPSLWIDSVLRALSVAGLQAGAGAPTAACRRRRRAPEPSPGNQAAALTRTSSSSAAGTTAAGAAAAGAAAAGAAAASLVPIAGSRGTDGGGGGGGAVTAGSGRRGVALLTSVQLTRLVWAVVELRAAAGREDVTRPWAGHLFSETQDRLRGLSASQLVDLVWNIGRGRRLPTGPWRRALAAALAAATPRLLPWQVARAMAGMAKLRLCMPYQVVAGVLRALLLQLDAAQPSDVAAVVWALRFVSWPYTEAFVRTHRRDLLDLAAATRPRLGSLEPPQLVQLADGFAHLRLLPGCEWMRLHREACIRLKTRFSEANRRKLRHAYAIIYTL